MGMKLQRNSLFFKMLCAVVAGIICVSVSVSYIIINISKSLFADTYSDSQKKIFEQVYDELYDFHGEVVKIINSVNSNRAVKLYLTNERLEVNESFKTIYNMQSHIKSLLLSNTYDINVLIVGLNEKTYLSRKELLNLEPNEMLDMNISRKTLENKNSILYQYLDKGFTSTTKDGPVIVITKSLTLENGAPYGIIYFTIKEKDFEKFYDYFTLEINDIVLLDENSTVISSNKKGNIGTKQIEFQSSITELIKNRQVSKSYNSNKSTILIQRLPYCDLTLCGTVDNYKALEKMYDVSEIIYICSIITIGILVVVFFIVRQVTKPLYILTEKMSNVRSGNFDEYVEVIGPEEVKELSATFNYMIKDLNKYIDELVKVQREKRAAEIHALQMQINPHYIFNTLSSVKWLIWQGNNEKSIRALDSFIILLRNTISITDEFITVDEEIENLKNYVFINNIRYGDKINVEYFVMPNCGDYLLPKLILQPFIENAFFHGFPSDEEGEIQVFVKEQGDNLRFEICDSGVGIEEDKLDSLKEKREVRNRHFTGIGVNNVDDRIKLIYGNEYGIEIKSKVNKGTTVIVILPKERKN